MFTHNIKLAIFHSEHTIRLSEIILNITPIHSNKKVRFPVPYKYLGLFSTERILKFITI